jgi:hypothetical protein
MNYATFLALLITFITLGLAEASITPQSPRLHFKGLWFTFLWFGLFFAILPSPEGNPFSDTEALLWFIWIIGAFLSVLYFFLWLLEVYDEWKPRLLWG